MKAFLASSAGCQPATQTTPLRDRRLTCPMAAWYDVHIDVYFHVYKRRLNDEGS
ncbi:MAG: hypothetical protein ACE5E7_15040 [Anaerolineae bacterium]